MHIILLILTIFRSHNYHSRYSLIIHSLILPALLLAHLIHFIFLFNSLAFRVSLMAFLVLRFTAQLISSGLIASHYGILVNFWCLFLVHNMASGVYFLSLIA